jgi:hypothetical protein
MINALDRRRDDGKALSPERQRMNEALARLGREGMRETRRRDGRLIVALDLTGSREHSLSEARIATTAMFDAVKSLGAIAVKLVYYRGLDECRASQWHNDPDILSKSMQWLSCEKGQTQIARVLRLVALGEREPVSGVVFIGDHCEDDAGEVRELAAVLGQRSIPVFVFHECADHDEDSLEAKPLFKALAAATGGVYCEFKPDSGAVLREMLSSVAAFSAAGVEGVKQTALPHTSEARQLQKRLLLSPSHGDNLTEKEHQ